MNIWNPFYRSYNVAIDKGITQRLPFSQYWKQLKKIRGSEDVFTTVPTDLSKTFNYLPHALLVAKLSARMFDKKSLISTSAFLYNREVD